MLKTLGRFIKESIILFIGVIIVVSSVSVISNWLDGEYDGEEIQQETAE